MQVLKDLMIDWGNSSNTVRNTLAQEVHISNSRNVLFTLTLMLYLAHALYAGISHRILYPDGTIFISYILESKKTIWFEYHRHFAHLIQHFPIVRLINNGVTDFDLLFSVHSTWYHSFGLLSILGCLAICGKRYFHLMLFPLISIYAVYLNTEFFAITPGRLLICFFWPVVLLTLLKRNIWASILVLLLAIPMLRIYQGMLFLGVFLYGIGLWRALRIETEVLKKGIWVITSLIFISGSFVALHYVLQPKDTASFLSFLFGVLLIADEELYPHMPLFISFLCLVWLFLAVRKPAINHSKWMIILFVGMAFVALSPVIIPQALAPEAHQQVRPYNIYLGLGLAIVLFLYLNGKLTVPTTIWNKGFLVFTILGIMQFTWNLQATSHWNTYLELFRKELSTKGPGLILYQDSELFDMNKHGLSSGLHNDWATARLSILVNPKKEIETIMAHTYDNIFKSLDARDKGKFNDFSAYGITYDKYFEALDQQGEVIIPDRELPAVFKWFDNTKKKRKKATQ